MSRPLIGLASAILIVAVCSWLVHVEGQSYRQRYRDTARDQLTKRLVRVKPIPGPDSPPHSPTKEKQVGPVADAVTLTQAQPFGAAAAQERNRSSQVPLEARQSKAVDAPPEPIKVVRPSLSTPLPPEARLSAPSLSGDSRRPVDANSRHDSQKLTRDELVSVGKAVHEVILRHHRVLPPGEGAAFRDRLHSLVIPLLERREQKDNEPQIFLIDSADAFAFSHLGGYIYLSPILARLIPEDVELEFILAHEIAHLDLHHGIEKVAKEMGAAASQPGQPGLVQRIYHQIADGYDSDQEYAADRWACEQLLKMGRSRHDILMFLRRLQNYNARQQGVAPLKPLAGLDADSQDVEHHWQRHPAIPYRLNKLEKFIDAGASQGSP